MSGRGGAIGAALGAAGCLWLCKTLGLGWYFFELCVRPWMGYILFLDPRVSSFVRRRGKNTS